MKQHHFNRRSGDFDDFAQFATGQPHQNGGGVSPDGIEPDYGYEEDEMDFTPQNGYAADEQGQTQIRFVPYQENDQEPTNEKKAPKERYEMKISIIANVNEN